jgi:hypothetical protein
MLFRMADTTDSRPPVIVEVNLSWPGVGGHEDNVYEIPRGEWDEMTPAERVAYCEELAVEDANNRFSWGWNIADPDDYEATEEPK